MNRYSYERDVFMTKTYTVKNLDCAHCGTKIEQELNRIEGAILNMKATLDTIKAGLRRIPFRLGTYRQMRI